jgi:hypothetical protein
MALRDRIRKAERKSGVTWIRCEECGQRWMGDAMLEVDYLAACWAQGIDSEAFVEGDMEALAAQPLKRPPNTSEVVWDLLQHRHQERLIVKTTGKPLCADLLEAWGVA